MRLLILRSSALLLALLVAAPSSAQLRGVGYRLAPAASYVVFEGDAGLSDDFLYGGGVGLSFGEFLELNGSYLFGNGFETDFSDFSGTEDDPDLADALMGLDGTEVDVQRYGGEIKLNLGTGTVVPFLVGGTGLIRFAPDGRETTRNIYLLGGAGLQFSGADRYAISVSVEDLAYRYNPGTTFFSADELADAGLGFENFNQTTVNNLAVRGSVSLYLGGRRPGSLSGIDQELRRQFSDGLSGLSLVVEPFYGRIEFDDAFAYRDQTFVGGEIGFDIGPLVGIRGFYGRGTATDDPTSFEDIQMVGGDLRLRLSEGGGLVPFLSVGGGYLDVLDGYADDDGAEPQNANAEDRPFAAGGAGVELFLSPRLRAIGEVRGIVMSTQDEEDLSQPEDVYVSPLFRGGLSFGLGGSAGRDVAVVRQEELTRERAEFEAALAAERADAAQREVELQAQIAEARAAGDSVAVAVLEAERVRVRAEADALPAASDTPASDNLTVVGREVRTAQGDRIITVPLPEQGELYVRYGDPGGVQIGEGFEGDVAAPTAAQTAPQLTQAEIREIVRQALRESLAAREDQDLTDADVAAIERRVEDRITDRIGDSLRPDDGVSASELARIERRLEDRMADEIRQLRQLILLQNQQNRPQGPVVVQPQAPAAQPPAVTVTPEGDTVTVRRPPPSDFVVTTVPEEYYGPTFSFSPTVGVEFGKGPESVVVGARGEYVTSPTFRYIPEILIGVGSRRFFSGSADVAYGVPVSSLSNVGTPYVRAGIGLVNYGGSDEVPDTFEEEIDDGGTTLTFNLGLGADLDYGGGRFFVDFTTGNLGRFNRLTAGYRFPFGRSAY